MSLNQSFVSSPNSSYNEFKSFDNRVAVPSLGGGPPDPTIPMVQQEEEVNELYYKRQRSITPESVVKSPEHTKKKIRLQRLKAAQSKHFKKQLSEEQSIGSGEIEEAVVKLMAQETTGRRRSMGRILDLGIAEVDKENFDNTL